MCVSRCMCACVGACGCVFACVCIYVCVCIGFFALVYVYVRVLVHMGTCFVEYNIISTVVAISSHHEELVMYLLTPYAGAVCKEHGA